MRFFVLALKFHIFADWGLSKLHDRNAREVIDNMHGNCTRQYLSLRGHDRSNLNFLDDVEANWYIMYGFSKNGSPFGIYRKYNDLREKKSELLLGVSCLYRYKRIEIEILKYICTLSNETIMYIFRLYSLLYVIY